MAPMTLPTGPLQPPLEEFIEPSSQHELDESIIDADVVSPHGQPCEACGCPIEAEDKFCPACGQAQVVEAKPVETISVV